ncbi:lipoprotein [Actinoplanes sp. NEAU-A12]|uniref:Lipoprotein n=1 Tax=Actinoplanes sandaracinus TaxID=3045177 RepID=A0ABT6WEE9_9ACTN|nr:lipoprotein [Actinoplanes sandaracinus]MDI6098072.1 lipoprotein [Actinoplanes sandaracinus]
MHAPGRVVMAAAAAMSVLVLTGCNNTEPTSPSAEGASSAATAKDRQAEDCEAVAGSLRDLVKSMISAELSTDSDSTAAIRKALTDYATTARGQAAKVTDPALRAAAERLAAAAEQLSKAKDPTDLDAPAFESGTAEMEKLCEGPLTPTASPGTPIMRLGAAGSACELPVTFDLVPLWKPEAVDLGKREDVAFLYRNGPFDAACVVDGKPAGEVGNLRVYIAKTLRTGTPRGHLEAFLAAESSDARKAGNLDVHNIRYTELTIGGQPAAEVTYEPYNKVMDHQSKYSAFALNTPRGAVVVKLAPFGADEYANVLPVYELAKKTLTMSN